MQILQIILIAILIILLAALVIICAVLFFPFKLRLNAKKDDVQIIKFSFSWFFRLVYATYAYAEKKGIFRLYVLGIPLHKFKFFKKLTKREENKKQDESIKSEKKDAEERSAKKIPRKKKSKKADYLDKAVNAVKRIADMEHKREMLNWTLDTLKKVLSSFKFTEFDVFLNFGFEDPSSTGYLTALLSVIVPFLPHKIIFRADFEKEVFILNAHIAARSSVWKVGCPIVMYILKIKSLEDEK